MSSEVYVYKAQNYNLKNLERIVGEALAGFDFKGKNVLIKPNMLQAHKPEEGVTTNPALVEAAARVILNRGGDCAVGDSPSGYGKENAEKVAEKTGFLDVCRRTGIKFDFFDEQDLRKIKIPEGRIYREVFLAESFFTYDFILNLPKLKTHSLTVFTLGVKNMLGVIPGLAKVDFHLKAAHPVKFASAICDLYSAVKPDFTILDGILGMQESGPVNGKLKKINRIFAGADAVALDAAIERMCGIKPDKVPITRQASERGLGKKDKFDIIKDYSDDEIEFKDFKTPFLTILGTKIPVWVLDFLPHLHLHRPAVVKDGCIKCKKCAQACPVDVITFNNDGYPEFDMRKCIKCFCCAERCPEKAIIEKTNFIAKLFS